MPQNSLIPSNIGKIAQSSLTQSRQAQVRGVTSQGVFLHLNSDWIVFLSREQFRGPLTLNIPQFPHAWQKLTSSQRVEIHAGNILFVGLDWIIPINSASPWSAPPPPAAPPENLAQRFQRLEAALQGVKINKSGFQPSAFGNQLLTVNRRMPEMDTKSLIAALIPNLGLGGGLTPAGDDLALGFLLAANRWGKLLRPSLDLPAINQALVQAAYARTSTLSANLIECAASGQADERLILALDGIITGFPGLEACISYLSAWGNSSGGYALQGMALAIWPGDA
jgi:hypothetical protein